MDLRAALSLSRSISATPIVEAAKVISIFGKRLGGRALVAAGVLCASATGAPAAPLTPFRYEAQAQRHCPGDQVVWLDFRKGVYYARGQKRYGEGADGSFVCRSEARAGLYRRSLRGLR